MREVKFLGSEKRKNDSRNYKYSIFLCPACEKEVVRKSKDGKKQKYCSHECYAKNRSPRGAYKEKVEISGYLYIYKPEHPDATKLGYVAEHRLVAENVLGRRLSNNEVVHHVNEDKHDNRPGNLEVMSVAEHNSYHAKVRRRDRYGKLTV